MKKALLIIFVGLIVFIAGCAKEKPKDLQFKNDVVTIENYVVDNVAPYASTDKVSNTITISFDIKNNGDKPVKWVKVNFFDTPGFEVILPQDTEQEGNAGSLECRKFGELMADSDDERTCTFGNPTSDSTILDDVIDPLDMRSVKFTLKTPKGITSPTPFTVSFSITYRYGSIQQANTYFFSGERTAIIPVIDPTFKKEPSSKFSQSEPTIGPIVFDIIPSLEREKVVNDKTIKEYWGIVNNPFQTKFVMKKVVSDGTIRDIPPVTDRYCENRIEGCVEIQLTNLELDITSSCDFIGRVDKAVSNKIVNEKSNTLVCSFKPTSQTGFTAEFTSMITIRYNYDYEIIRKQNFVVYPAIS